MKSLHRPIAIDLFCGAGGFSLGFESAGFDVIASVDIDPIHCAVHKYNFPNCETICADVTRLSAEELRLRIGLGDTRVDVVFGGPPCQGFSLMGKRALDDPRNSLAAAFVTLAAGLKARYIVFENVKGLTIGKHKTFLEELIERFAELKYEVLLPYRVLNAADYGVPQDRQRLFLLAARKGEALPSYPHPEVVRADSTQLSLFTQGLSCGPTVWDAIGDLPDAETFPELLVSDSVRATHRASRSPYASVLHGDSRDSDDYGCRRSYDRALITSSRRTDHSEESRKRFREATHGSTEPVSRFYKLDPRGLCHTLRAGTASDRGAFTSPRPIHPSFARCITVREAARLHSYPDWFRFHVTKWHGARQIGNSVPPLLGRAIASSIRRAMKVTPTRTTKDVTLSQESLLHLTMKEAADMFGVSPSIIPQRLRSASPSQSATPKTSKDVERVQTAKAVNIP